MVSRELMPDTELCRPQAQAETRGPSRDPLIHQFREIASTGRHGLVRALPRHNPGGFAQSVVDGLKRTKRSLDCRYLYDAEGSQIYEEITRQPEYYLTRTEAAILAEHAERIRRQVGASTLLELGSGSSTKTGHLLSAWASADPSKRATYIPVDVSASALHGAIGQISPHFPKVRFIGVHGTYGHGLALLGEVRPAMCVFLGSTLGNFDEHGMDAFLRMVAQQLHRSDRFLLGVDLVKDATLLEAAYDDRAGVTRMFTLNLFKRMNRELGSRIDIDSIEHVAKYVEEREQVEIYARFHRRQRIVVRPLDCTLTVEAGEDVLVEVSRKFRVSALAARLNAAGLAVDDVYGDANGWFAVLLLRPSDD